MANRLGPDDLVVIAGGGISGLALAAALQSRAPERRPKVIVLERDPTFEARRQGYGVTLSETNAALDGLGILHDLRARNTRSRAHWTFHSDGRVLGYYGAAFLPKRMRKPSPWTNLRVPRNEVREVLASRLLPGTVRFGCRAVGYVEDFACGVVDVTVETVRRERETGAGRLSVENCSDDAIRNEEKVGGGAGRPDWMDADGEGRRAGEREGVVETLRASLLVACDGVRSAVQRVRHEGTDRELKYLGVVLITGFTTLRHPLLDQQGFYTLDGERARIFTMPFKSGRAARGRGAGWEENEPREELEPTVARADEDEEEEEETADKRGDGSSSSHLTMWQISVRVTETQARSIASAPRAGPGGVKEFVLSVTEGWHDPIAQMFANAVWEESWAGPLYDRDRPPPPPTGANAKSRVVAIGDAAHPMSPFKGMGANSALFDAWSLATWLEKAPTPRAIANFEREMIARAWAKVDASREAVDLFHGPAAVARTSPEFAGIEPGLAREFLETLDDKGVNAGMGGDLERVVKEHIAEFGVPVDEANSAKPYVYLRDRGGVDKSTDAPPSDESPIKRAPPLDTSRQLEALRAAVDAGVRAGLDAAGAAPVTGEFEAFSSAQLVPAKKYGARKRPAHDWVSRAALKIVHGRRGQESSEEHEPAPDENDAPDATVELTPFQRKALRRERLDDANRCVGAEIARLARKICEELRRAPRRSLIADARVGEDGQILITSARRRDELRAKGLIMCGGCGSFYAVHGGGLRQHWAIGGITDACAAAAAAAASPHMTDEEALIAAGRDEDDARDVSEMETNLGTAAESSSWRGSGKGRPGPWREKKSNDSHLHDPGLRAAADGDVAGMITALSRHGFDPHTAVDSYGSGALHWAAGGGHVAACDWLVEENKIPVNGSRRKDGRAPLHWAARNGHLETCKWLVTHGADPNLKTYDGDGAFNLAVWQGHLPVAEYLASLGSAVDATGTNRWGCNSLLWACIQHDPKGGGGGGCGTMKPSLSPNPNPNPKSPIDTVRWLVNELKVPATVLNVNGHSAIHKCAIYGHGDVIAWLLTDTGCNAAEYMGPDDRGSSPSALAAANGYAQLAAELRDVEDRTLRLPAVYNGN